MTACQASGGGTLPSAISCSTTAQTAATFGFQAYQAIDSPTVTFAGTYADRCAGVLLSSTGQLKPMAPPDFVPPVFGSCLSGTAAYTSVHPVKPGSGTLDLVVCDQAGPPATDSTDFISISMSGDTGPYHGYSNAGVLTVGQPTPGMGTGNIVVQL